MASDQHNKNREESGHSHRGSSRPFELMRQGIDEMDRWFSEISREGGWWSRVGAPSWGGSSPRASGEWSPAVEVFQRGHEFVVRADVPGMVRHDLHVDVSDDSLTIRGERKQETREERDGAFWTERSYGPFSRTIPLPPGAIGDSAKASFNNGVLEVVIQAPPQEARRGRKVDISGAGTGER